ncbi:molybdopterin dinucleotide binding domain protein, partial [Vibrio parahaemolyticus VPTS-2010]
DL